MDLTKNTKYKLVALGGSSLAALPFVGTAQAADCSTTGNAVQTGANCAKGNGQPDDLQTQITTITNTLLLVVGIAAVIMLIVGGFQYIFSSGDQARVGSAKNTILYAIIGIVVALLAYAIVNFVVGRFGTS